jgi:methylenetetrahydrofolate reductase (NADPH)
MSVLAVAGILVRHGVEPILQFTCRDRNRIALQSDLIGAAALGVRNLLMLTGDDPRAGDQPDAKPVFDFDSRRLVETAVAMRDRNELPSGCKIAGDADFFIGVADAPLIPLPAGARSHCKTRLSPVRNLPRPGSAWMPELPTAL